VRVMLSEAMQDAGAELSRLVRGYLGPRRRVLVVDDDHTHVEFMRGLLQPLGFEVAAVHVGADAVAAAVPPPDLIMVDLSLPDMTGWDVMRRLRAVPELQQVRVLVVSANAHEYAPDSEATLHDGFVMKPVEVSVLLAALQRQLHLEWAYAGELTAPAAAPQVTPELARRCARHLEDLWQLGQIGHVRGIQSRLRDFELQEPEAKPLVELLRGMVEKFDMKRYMATVKGLREDS
jgi:CheY-like chemotaxis protein